jgi:hypothetical protein
VSAPFCFVLERDATQFLAVVFFSSLQKLWHRCSDDTIAAKQAMQQHHKAQDVEELTLQGTVTLKNNMAPQRIDVVKIKIDDGEWCRLKTIASK